MVIYMLNTNKLDCIRMHRNNIRFQEGNKHEMYHFSLFTFTRAQVMPYRTHERAKCHMHAYHTRTNVLHRRATRTNKPERLCDRCNLFA